MPSDQCSIISNLLREIILRNDFEGLLLSGGLDSSIIASIQKPKYSITTSLNNCGTDLHFARLVAEKFSLNHFEIILKPLDLLRIEEQIVKLFKTFDPIFIKNSSVIYASLEKAKEQNIPALFTGDGGDELFAGYNYLKRYYHDPEKLSEELKRLWNIMHFPSETIGKFFQIQIISPFLDEEFVSLAKSIDIKDKIGIHEKEIWGKYILRKCFEDLVGNKISWRRKLAQEEGSGFSEIYVVIDKIISDSKFEESSRKSLTEGVKIRSKEHQLYYDFYRKYFSPPIDKSCCSLRCPDCNGCFLSLGKFCRICGAYPVNPI